MFRGQQAAQSLAEMWFKERRTFVNTQGSTRSLPRCPGKTSPTIRCLHLHTRMISLLFFSMRRYLLSFFSRPCHTFVDTHVYDIDVICFVSRRVLFSFFVLIFFVVHQYCFVVCCDQRPAVVSTTQSNMCYQNQAIKTIYAPHHPRPWWCLILSRNGVVLDFSYMVHE